MKLLIGLLLAAGLQAQYTPPSTGGGTGCVPSGGANAVLTGDGLGGCGPNTTAAGFLTFMGTPTSANFLSLLTTKTGTGNAVFGTGPTITLPNATGLPDGGLTLTDVTTNDTSTSKHGFAPKLDNVVTHFLNGQGGWTVPPGGGSGCTTSGTGVQTGDGAGGCTNNSGVTISSGSMSLTGGIATGGVTNACDGTAGCNQMSQGTAPSGLPTTGIQVIAPSSVTSYRDVRPGTVGTTGVEHVSVSSTTATHSYSPVVNADIANSTIDLTAKVTGVLPTANIAVALANQTSLRGNGMAAAAGDATITQTIAHGSKALDFASTATGACATVITDTATGTLSTDVIVFNANASIKAVTGYVPASTGGFSITAYPTADTVNFEACNWTAGTVDPGSITVNWKVIR